MSELLKTFPVLNLFVHLSPDYPGWLLDRLAEGRGAHVVTLNAEMSMAAEQDPAIATVIREADLVIPDGAGIVIYLKLKGLNQQRCPGIELAEAMVRAVGERGADYPIAFYGAKPEVMERAAQRWRDRIPDINLITRHGYIDAGEMEEWKHVLKETQPKLILVGLGVPRQENWIRENRSLCPEAIWIGVGGSFDIWSGIKQRAPKFFLDNHLEWLYRLYQEPWRWRRMLALPQFLWKAFWSKPRSV
jgi:N-acetylglucosaminyldiphosphoundecaprenol N-acetyl-beta-D-mannosaminyltransferase